MTEDEAKRKWCPMRKDRHPYANEGDQNCIASDCMAWRWIHAPKDPEPNEARIYVPDGYCGLAGQ